MKQHIWKDEANCLGLETDLYFDKYENDENVRPNVDALCRTCPVAKICFANGITGKEYGVWGGVYLDNGDISREFNKHKSKEDWANTWTSLTME